MPHSWVAYEIAERITTKLVEGDYISDKKSGSFGLLEIRGMIQLLIEDNYEVRKKKFQSPFED